MQVIEKAIAVLELLGEQEDLTVSEISEKLDLPIPTVHRLLTSLTRPGLLEKDLKRRTYRLGWAFLYLGSRAIERCGHCCGLSVLHPCLKKLTEQTGEVSSLCALLGDRVVCLDRVEGDGCFHLVPEGGRDLPFHASAPGKVVLAWQPPRVYAALLRNRDFVAYTDRTITDPEQFRAELAEVRRRGFAAAVDEMAAGCAALAAPVLDGDGELVAVLSLLGDSLRIGGRMDGLSLLLLECADEASRLIRDCQNPMVLRPDSPPGGI